MKKMAGAFLTIPLIAAASLDWAGAGSLTATTH